MKAAIYTRVSTTDQNCDLQLRDVPFFLQGFVDCYEGRYYDVQLPLPMRLA